MIDRRTRRTLILTALCLASGIASAAQQRWDFTISGLRSNLEWSPDHAVRGFFIGEDLDGNGILELDASHGEVARFALQGFLLAPAYSVEVVAPPGHDGYGYPAVYYANTSAFRYVIGTNTMAFASSMYMHLKEHKDGIYGHAALGWRLNQDDRFVEDPLAGLDLLWQGSPDRPYAAFDSYPSASEPMTITVTAAVPEPATLSLLLLGMAALLPSRRRRFEERQTPST